MTRKRRLAIAGFALVILIGTGVVWFAVISNRNQLPKTTAELLVGKWRYVWRADERNPNPELNSAIPNEFQPIFEFTHDGKWISTIRDFRNSCWEVTTASYELDGNNLKFQPASSENPSYDSGETSEFINVIESINGDELILSTLMRKRWSTERAQKLAVIRNIPVGQVLDEVRETRFRSKYVRINE